MKKENKIKSTVNDLDRKLIGKGDDDSGGSDESNDMYNRSAELVLVSASDSYSEDKEILVDDSRHSFCPVYTIY